MKLRAIKFLQSVLIEGKQVEAAALGEASAVGVVVTCSPVVLVPWHMVRYAEVVDEVADWRAQNCKSEPPVSDLAEAPAKRKRGKPTP